MRQSEFKRRYDVKTGRYVKKHIYGEGVTDVFKTIGRKLFGKTMKEAANVTSNRTGQSAAGTRRIQGFFQSNLFETQIHQQYSNNKIKQNKINGNY